MTNQTKVDGLTVSELIAELQELQARTSSETKVLFDPYWVLVNQDLSNEEDPEFEPIEITEVLKGELKPFAQGFRTYIFIR